MRKARESVRYLLDSVVTKKDKSTAYYKSSNYYEWYYTYGYTFRPKRVLELGVKFGYSLISIAAGCLAWQGTEVELVGVDNESDTPGSLATATANIHKVLPSVRCNLVKADTKDLPELVKANKYDLIHLDAEHGSGTVKEIQGTWSLLNKGGVLVIDDMGSALSMQDTAYSWEQRLFVDAELNKLYYQNEIESISYINSHQGHCLVVKI